ncbi:molybdopterin-guanine dinucleotide biosynthesis protein B [Thermoanaerobacter wiegelii]|uniref:Molybdopterin-guanine dinucleotide biosynthesis protein B n=1 Tax=Thermoanaerobacter wiegelii Rt8.B1 TaxID=697303 RepID=G2MUW8_9THEO|nr:molybdopterin-guanine dinucleotide biosynthesis protein B [Thermoanaerobacter wiegelii]AEM77869.1 molybdopterin-guanine dinucleotide biosynthesis protein B [Thermoanaerobacter wiegelii Rt8.B1]
MKIIGVIGTKDTGKTTLVTKIVRKLVDEGYRVVTLKHTHTGFDFADKDTGKHREAGAELVVGSGEETFFLLGRKMVLDELVGTIQLLGDFDFLVIEGFKEMPYANISTSTENEFTIRKVDPFSLKEEELDELIEVIKNRSYCLLQGLNCKKCGFESCRDFAMAKVQGAADDINCKSQPKGALLKINGHPVPMNPFVQEFISKTVLGMIDALDMKNHKIEKVELIIKNNYE